MAYQYRGGTRTFRVLDVSGSSLNGTEIRDSDFNSSTFRRCRLSEVTFDRCSFVGTTFREAEFAGRITFRDCTMARATFYLASLAGVTFESCELSSSIFEGAQLANVGFRKCDLVETSFHESKFTKCEFVECHVNNPVCSGATFSATDLTGLAQTARVVFGDGAIIDWRSVCRSLRAVDLERLLVLSGMPEVFATYSVSCAKAIDPDRLFKLMRSTFISYGSPDFEFALRLRNDLRRNGVETFFFASDATPGDRLHDVMRRGVNRYDRIIVIASADSLMRSGVRNEIQEAREREARDGGAAYLLPVAIDDAVFKMNDELVAVLRGRVVADFRKPEEYTQALGSLLRALSRGAIDGA